MNIFWEEQQKYLSESSRKSVRYHIFIVVWVWLQNLQPSLMKFVLMKKQTVVLLFYKVVDV